MTPPGSLKTNARFRERVFDSRVETPSDGVKPGAKMPEVGRALAALALSVLAACGGEGAAWTVREAESIAAVRGTPINDPKCRGLGLPTNGRYRRFGCTAGARRPGETADTVAILYELVPRGEYAGPRSDHDLENVRFVGGPGIP
jgi:hypothetical protein